MRCWCIPTQTYFLNGTPSRRTKGVLWSYINRWHRLGKTLVPSEHPAVLPVAVIQYDQQKKRGGYGQAQFDIVSNSFFNICFGNILIKGVVSICKRLLSNCTVKALIYFLRSVSVWEMFVWQGGRSKSRKNPCESFESVREERKSSSRDYSNTQTRGKHLVSLRHGCRVRGKTKPNKEPHRTQKP
jgi:hypothetical protein